MENRFDLLREYTDKPPDNILNLSADQLQRLCTSPKLNLRMKFFEVLGTHESDKIRQLATNIIQTNVLPNHKREYLELWLRFPYTNFLEVAIKFADSYELQNYTALRSGVYILSDKFPKAFEIDSNLDELEELVRADPALYAPIGERITQIRKKEFHRVVSDRTIVVPYEKFHVDAVLDDLEGIDRLIRLLRSEDWSQAWIQLRLTSFISIVENFQNFKLSNWKPKRQNEIFLFEMLSEYVGFGGWRSCESLLQLIIEDPNERYKGIDFLVYPSLFSNNSSNHEISDYNANEETMQLSGKHILSINLGKTPLLKVVRPNYLSGKINQIGLECFFYPITKFTSDHFRWILSINKELSYSTNYFDLELRPFLLALREFAEHQSNFRYSISTKPVSFKIPKTDQSIDLRKIKYAIGLDFGNSKTAISFFDINQNRFLAGNKMVIDTEDSSIEMFDDGIVIPSLIQYLPGKKCRIGKSVETHWAEQSVFKGMKRSLRHGHIHRILVGDRYVQAVDATIDFLSGIASKLNLKQEYIHSFGISCPVDAPTKYKEIIKDSVATNFKIADSIIEIYDEATSSIIGADQYLNRIANKAILVIDIGGGTTDVTILQIGNNLRRTQIYFSATRDIGGLDIDGAAFELGRELSKDFDVPKNELIFKCMQAKHEIVDKGEMGPFVFSDKLESFKFTYEELNTYLIEDDFYSGFMTVITGALLQAKRRGLAAIDLIYLNGGGAKWQYFKKLLEQKYQDIPVIQNFDPLSVSKGISRASIGLSISTLLPHPLGVIHFQNQKSVFTTLLPEGLNIPSEEFRLIFEPEDAISNLFVDIHRRRIRIGEEKVLLFGEQGEASIQKIDTFIYFEPIRDEILSVNWETDEIYLKIDEKGHCIIYIQNEQKSDRIDLGGIL